MTFIHNGEIYNNATRVQKEAGRQFLIFKAIS